MKIHSNHNWINTGLSKAIIWSLILPLAFVTVFCCNISGMAEANVDVRTVVAAEKNLPPCHRSSSQTASSAQDTQNCCNPRLQADTPIKISLNIPQIVRDLTAFDLLLESAIVFKTYSTFISFNGPPGLDTSSTPLYIHFRNFRI